MLEEFNDLRERFEQSERFPVLRSDFLKLLREKGTKNSRFWNIFTMTGMVTIGGEQEKRKVKIDLSRDLQSPSQQALQVIVDMGDDFAMKYEIGWSERSSYAIGMKADREIDRKRNIGDVEIDQLRAICAQIANPQE